MVFFQKLQSINIWVKKIRTCIGRTSLIFSHFNYCKLQNTHKMASRKETVKSLRLHIFLVAQWTYYSWIQINLPFKNWNLCGRALISVALSSNEWFKVPTPWYNLVFIKCNTWTPFSTSVLHLFNIVSKMFELVKKYPISK